MSQRIHNGAIVIREGRLWLHRPAPAGVWELPGGLVPPEQLDVDEAMDVRLQELGIRAPAVEEDFVETIYLRDDEGPVVFNVYAPSEWEGEPTVAPGTGSGWFALDELESVDMDATLRQALLDLFGVRSRPDDAAEILAALEASSDVGAAVADAPAATTTGASDRRTAGLDVLRTLRGTGDDTEAAFAGLREWQPGLAEDVVDFALGEVWSHPALDRKTRSLQVVAMLSALGKTSTLQAHVEGALNHGATPTQIAQTLRMVAVYAGFPAAIEAWDVMARVFRKRGIAIPGAKR